MDLLGSKSRSKKRLPLSELFSDGVHLNDETKPALKPDAKIRRMTESNVIVFQRPLQSAGTSARLSGKIRRRPSRHIIAEETNVRRQSPIRGV